MGNVAPEIRVTNRGIKALSGLTEMKNLGIRNATEVTDLRPLASMKKLEILDLFGTNVNDEGISVVESLSSLEWLDIRFTKVTDLGLTHIAKAPMLKILDCGFYRRSQEDPMNITDAGMLYLAGSQLETLDLAGTKVTIASIPVFKTMTHLKHLTVPQWYPRNDLVSWTRIRKDLQKTNPKISVWGP